MESISFSQSIPDSDKRYYDGIYRNIEEQLGE